MFGLQRFSRSFTLKYDLEAFRGDVFGGITAAVVGLPVALAFGVASGLGAVAGIYGAITVGFFAAVFGGTKSQISGPTGPMAVAMAVVVTTHADNLVDAFTIVILAGIIQILLGIFRVGRFVSYTPYSVISGFMSGIGVIIIVLQTLPFMGAAVAAGGPIDAIEAWPNAVSEFNTSTFAVAAVTLVVGILWPRRLSRYFPSTLAALLVGTLLGALWLIDAPTIGDVPTGLPSIQIPDFSTHILITAVQPAVIIALLGSIDSLLTSLIADAITRTRHDPNRELIGQGTGNSVAGLIGGLPGAGATLGTVINIRAGGRSPVSGVIRAGILLALVLGVGRYAEIIPHAALAGILIKVGWDIIDWRFMKRIHRVQREHLVVMIVTMGLTIFLDLVTAVAIGLIVAGMATARQLERLELDSVASFPLLDRTFFASRTDTSEIDEYAARVGIVALRGSFTVASSNRLITAISEDIREHEVVVLDFTNTVYIDDSAALVVEQMIEVANDEDTATIVMGLDEDAEATLQGLGALDDVPVENFVVDINEAADVAFRILDEETQG